MVSFIMFQVTYLKGVFKKSALFSRLRHGVPSATERAGLISSPLKLRVRHGILALPDNLRSMIKNYSDSHYFTDYLWNCMYLFMY